MSEEEEKMVSRKDFFTREENYRDPRLVDEWGGTPTILCKEDVDYFIEVTLPSLMGIPPQNEKENEE